MRALLRVVITSYNKGYQKVHYKGYVSAIDKDSLGAPLQACRCPEHLGCKQESDVSL